jgi:hypothetical protein
MRLRQTPQLAPQSVAVVMHMLIAAVMPMLVGWAMLMLAG